MTDTITPYRSALPTGRDGFAQVLRAEWTKLRTVRGWVLGIVVAGLVMVLFGLLMGFGSRSSYQPDPQGPDIIGHPYIPIGPNGGAVTDRFHFVHLPLDGDGSITTRLTGLTGAIVSREGGPASSGPATIEPAEIQPWAKAGLMIKENTEQGSAYAAIMVTGAHGVRMQHNFTEDVAGPTGTVSATSPRWLRLTRTGDTVTGYASTDGSTWDTVGTADLAGLPATAQAGLFVASPPRENTFQTLGGGGSITGGPTVATATFDTVDRQGGWAGDAWAADTVGDDPMNAAGTNEFRQSGGEFTVSGNGDVAPNVAGSGATIAQTLLGAFAALAVVVVLGALFITTEYRRGLIRTSLTARPRRGQVLAAKAIVLGAATFVIGLIAAAITVPVTVRVLESNGNFVYPVPWLTEVRAIAGTAAVLAVASVLALALGVILRRSAAAVSAVTALTVLPYLLSTAGVLPEVPAQWLLRLTPAAGFAVQQTSPQYAHVDHAYAPVFGFFPIGPWAGFAVLCGYAAVAMAGAFYLLRRRDA